MKLVTYYTPSHEHLFREYFLPSIKDPFDLRAYTDNQVCPTGTFTQEGWNETCRAKLGCVIAQMKTRPGECLVYSDVDVIFRRPVESQLLDELGDLDFAAQQDVDHPCTGFFIVRSTPSTIALFEEVYQETPKYRDDQIAFLHIAAPHIRGTYLSRDFYNLGRMWRGTEPLEPTPTNMAMFHANWTIGIPNKIALLEHFRGDKTDATSIADQGNQSRGEPRRATSRDLLECSQCPAV